MSAIGQAVPLILVPRFTTYAGRGAYTSVPVDVSPFSSGSITVWRGPLIGDSGAGALFQCDFQASHDAEEWETVVPLPPLPPITTTNTWSVEGVPLLKRWFRVRTRLTADTSGVVAVTMWASGLLERRLD